MLRYKRVIKRFLALSLLTVMIFFIVSAAKFVKEETKSSKYQSEYLSSIAQKLDFKVEPGPNSKIRYPKYGPYDQRLGYTLLPDAIAKLEKSGYSVVAQAKSSEMMDQLFDYGLYPIYQEKTQTGLRITDQNENILFSANYPTYGYPTFESIPSLVLQTLLFIENRELLDDTHTNKNPAVEWDRLGFAGVQLIAKKLGSNINVPGGSTLATQLEKYRHSPEGITRTLSDKFIQMGSASLRAYLLGPDTREMRKIIAHTYLNSMPLAATPKLGEIHGLGDGLSAWFGADFNEVNTLLSDPSINQSTEITPAQAQAFRQVLSLLLSQRRPSYLLGSGFEALQTLTDSYLRIMATQGVISEALRDAALQAQVVIPPRENSVPARFMVEKKTQSVLRSRLARAIGVKSIYELDRLDLSVKTTIDFETQKSVAKALRRLSEPDGAKAAGAVGFRLLSETNDPSPIIYSLMLFERGDKGNLLRIQTDNYDQPLDINEGIKLDLGSTSKLRTMVNYLEIISLIYGQFKDFSAEELTKVPLHPRDYLSAWVIGHLKTTPDISLEALLNQALDRRYSASPGESFFTGGGLHRFNNFTRDENNKIMSVRNALKDSVNLVFIRLMRDIVYHHLYKPGGIARWMEDPNDARRQEYLEHFADQEGQVYLRRFYSRYKGKSAQEVLEMLARRVKPKASRLTMLYQAIYPDSDIDALTAFLKSHLPASALANEKIDKLKDKYSPATFNLQDQGYITKIHPLELWLANYMANHPEADRDDIIEASAEQRIDVYRWLFKSTRKNAQNRRIMTLLEAKAFEEIHRDWQRVGYPFGRLTPSYATSIGASGDRPVALAELMGVLQNNGVKQPLIRFEKLHFAEGTPYETTMNRLSDQGIRVFAPEVAKVAKEALLGVVQGGTATRLRGVYTDAQGTQLAVGGKTGTGDHRRQVRGERGVLLQSQFISRAATFAFFMGDRFFGVITAYVEGPEAEKYRFTSSLPVQIIKSLEPTLAPLIRKPFGIDKTKQEVNLVATDKNHS